MANEYAAAADVLATLGTDILTDLAQDSDSIGATNHTLSLIEAASRIADSYIGARYVVPLTGTQALANVKPHVVSMARWMLLERRFSGRYDTEGARWLYEQALEWLKGVSKGDYALSGGTSLGASTSTAAGTTSWTSNTVMYPVGTARGF